MSHRFYFNGRYGWCASRTHGIWWIRLGRYLFSIKAPRNEPLFSERYGGYTLRIPLGSGWRFIFTNNKLPEQQS